MTVQNKINKLIASNSLETVVCSYCEGKGGKIDPYGGDSGMNQVWDECYKCNGTGKKMLPGIIGSKPTIWKLGKFTILNIKAEKVCVSCLKVVPDTSTVKDTCPHCHEFWKYEKRIGPGLKLT